MELVPVVFSSGWASGVNAYATILVLGLFGRFTDVATFPIPDVLTRTDVLVAAALLFTVEFVADKIPYLDSAWDLVSTAIRPSVGAVIALLVSGDASSLDQALYATIGGGTALLSHLVKSFFEGSPALLVLDVLEGEQLDPEEAERLKQLIREF